MIKPNLFIVGAPKCGTTSLYYYLKQHPEVYFPKIKEPHFFIRDLIPLNEIMTGEDIKDYVTYKKLYDVDGYYIYGDASVFYLYFYQSSRKIYEYNKNAKIIIMLRNPVEMMYSLFGELKYWGIETEFDFVTAVKTSEKRFKDEDYKLRKYKDYFFSKELIRYQRISNYSQQIKEYLKVFSRENIFIIEFNEFKDKTNYIMKKICSFLRIDPNFDFKIKIHNPYEEIRYPFIRDMQLKLTNNKFLRRCKKLIPSQIYSFISKSLWRINSVRKQRRKLNIEEIKYLKRITRENVLELSRMLGINFYKLWHYENFNSE